MMRRAGSTSHARIRRGCSLVAALAAVAAVPQPTAAVHDPYPRREGIDVEAYRFELTLSDTVDAFTGRATVTVRFTQDGVAALPLDLTGVQADGRGMTVTAVTAEGRPLTFTHVDDVLDIRLAEPSVAGSRAQIVIDYHGTPTTGLHIGPNKHGERTWFSDNWPNRARAWLPTIDHVSDKAANELVVVAPAHYQVVSNGLLVEETDRADGTRLTHWRNTVPIAPWLYVLGVARFAVQHLDTVDGVPIQTWVYARDRDAGFYDFAVPTRAAMQYYQSYVGPYAYEKLANITSPVTGGGMEAASAIMYHEDAVTGERTTRWRNVIIHEIAHQWFGNAVTESDWDDVWLSEGFATYFTLLFIEHAYGRDEFVDGLRSAAERVWAWYDENPDYRIVHDNLDDMGRVTSIATYQKGAWVLHMLRKRLGDEAFHEGIRRYYARFYNANATTLDFRQTIEEASGQDLEVFFEQWLYRGGNPRLEGAWWYDAARRAVVVELRQTQAGAPFHLPLEVGIYSGGQRTPVRLETVELTGREHRFELPVDAEPADVRLDPGAWALFRGGMERSR
ncbi:MAG: M1 family aminopeptidase [Gemmatimonadota bacterium]